MSLPKSFIDKLAFFRSKVARRIFVLFVLCALIPLSVLAYFSLSQVTGSLYTQAQEGLHQASKASGLTMFERLQFLETDLDLTTTILAKRTKDVMFRLIPGLEERLKARFKGLILRTGNGRTKILFGDISAVPRLTKEEQDHIHSGKTLVLTRVTAGNPAHIYMVKALDSLKPSPGLLFCEINPLYIWGGDGFLSPLTELLVFDQSGNVLFSSFSGYAPLEEYKRALREKPSTPGFVWTYGNNSYLASYWNLFILHQFHANWTVIQSRSTIDILAPTRNFKKIFLLLVLLTFCIAVLLSLIQIRRSLVPIELLRAATQEIAAKKFDGRVTIRTNDEFEDLGGAFNDMASSLENNLQIMASLNRIGIALSAEKNNDRLLELILVGAQKITNADGRALYTITTDNQLSLAAMHIDSMNRTKDAGVDLVVPLYDEEGKPNIRSAIAFSALNDATVNVPDTYHARDFDFTRHQDLDKTLGYQTRSFLSVPVKDHENKIVGVLQLFNAQDRLSRKVVTFSGEDQRLLETLASQAAMALSKNKLIEDLKERSRDLRKANEQLIQEKSFSDTIIDNLPGIFFICDENGRLMRWNSNEKEITDDSRHEILKMNILDLFPQDREIVENIMSEIFKKGQAAAEASIVTKSGVIIPFYLTGFRMQVKDKPYFVGVGINISERSRLEQQLRHSQKMEAVGLLAGGIAHDFNNILTAIIGYGTLTQMNLKQDDPLRLNIEEILSAAQRATSLTQGLLTFSRKQIINTMPVDLNLTIERISKLLRRMIGEDIVLTLSFTKSDLIVTADSSQIDQVLMNLATNARDAMPKGGSLHITTAQVELDEEYCLTHTDMKAGSYALIAVSDTGEGMNAETVRRLFEPFYTTKGIGQGTGLGMSIVFGIVKQHNGAINVYSEQGLGTTFKIYLPLTRAASTHEKQSSRSTRMKGGEEVILLAEDDLTIRKMTTALLEEVGYTVIQAVDGEDALNKLTSEKDRIQFLLLDVIMPKKNGKEVYDEAKKIIPHVKALFVSGYTADIIRKKGIIDEGLDFISKPVSPNELLEKIRELMEK